MNKHKYSEDKCSNMKCLWLTKRSMPVTPIAQLTLITPAYHDTHLGNFSNIPVAFTLLWFRYGLNLQYIINVTVYRRKITQNKTSNKHERFYIYPCVILNRFYFIYRCGMMNLLSLH